MTTRKLNHHCGCVTESDDARPMLIVCQPCKAHKGNDLLIKFKLTKHQRRFHPQWRGMKFGKGSGSMELKVKAVVHARATILEDKPDGPEIHTQTPDMSIQTHLEIVETRPQGIHPRMITFQGPTPFKAGQTLRLEVVADLPEKVAAQRDFEESGTPVISEWSVPKQKAPEQRTPEAHEAPATLPPMQEGEHPPVSDKPANEATLG